MFYAALDVSLRSVAVCIIDKTGKVRLECAVSSELPDLIRCVREFGSTNPAGRPREGNLSHHLAARRTEAAFDVVCMEPPPQTYDWFCGRRRTPPMMSTADLIFEHLE